MGQQKRKKLHCYTDGCCRGNPGLSCSGVVITSPTGKILLTHSARAGVGTNNESEYRAAIVGLKKCAEITCGTRDNPHGDITVFSDSRLLVQQSMRQWRTKKIHLQVLRREVVELMQCFQKVTFKWVARHHKHIQLADVLANQECDAFEREAIRESAEA